MNKPTVFLSHSSKDAEVTSKTLALFLSSDGQSIPFGRNWVASIEQALDSSTLMFSFLSPSSVNSAWINFEAGYAYSKGVKVIPVAILGFDLNRLTPPLSLLQGFNLKSHEGMNNVLSAINDNFNTEYPLSFSHSQYDETFTNAEKASIPYLGIAAKNIDYIGLGFIDNNL